MSLRSRLRAFLGIPDVEKELREMKEALAQLSKSVEALQKKMNAQDEQIKKILTEVNRKADVGLYYELSERLESARDEISDVEKKLTLLQERIKLLEFSASEKSEEAEITMEELASAVELYIRKGITSPSELKKAVGVSWEKLYSALEYLKLKKRIKRIQKGRRVRWVLVEEGQD